MNQPSGSAVSPQHRFQAIVAEYADRPEVTRHGGMMSASVQLRVRERIFAMLVGDRLVVKIPAEAVDELVAAGTAEPFRTAGRIMKEWASIGPAMAAEWPGWVAEALTFVSSQRGTRTKGR